MLEKVQMRATSLVPELRELAYPERLAELGLTTLETRRVRGDLIEVFKIMHGYDNLERSQFFKLRREVHSYPTSGHNLCIYHKFPKKELRKGFFDIRIIEKWNKLPEQVVNSQSISSFKRALDVLLERGTHEP